MSTSSSPTQRLCRAAFTVTFAAILVPMSAAAEPSGGAAPRRVLPKRCESASDETRPCADLSDSVDQWFGEYAGQGGGGGGGSGSLALIVATETVVASTLMGQELGIHVGGTGPLLSWRIGAGIHHAFNAPSFGFALSAAGGVRLSNFSRWSVVLGIKFINMTSFYDGAAEEPSQHILGELGFCYDAPLSGALMMRFGLSGLIGVERRTVARFEAAREVIDELSTLSGGGLFRVSLWIR